ncbi:hypothetical protein ACHAW5_002243 [Stephanodiscus triporus]|uniref:Anaphase-promoting complex subunit 1 n=1 Tax=Stephanodiscus triporus TaxID=2934178 RepID=A0ABD3QML1_9STRA
MASFWLRVMQCFTDFPPFPPDLSALSAETYRRGRRDFDPHAFIVDAILGEMGDSSRVSSAGGGLFSTSTLPLLLARLVFSENCPSSIPLCFFAERSTPMIRTRSLSNERFWEYDNKVHNVGNKVGDRTASTIRDRIGRRIGVGDDDEDSDNKVDPGKGSNDDDDNNNDNGSDGGSNKSTWDEEILRELGLLDALVEDDDGFDASQDHDAKGDELATSSLARNNIDIGASRQAVIMSMLSPS